MFCSFHFRVCFCYLIFWSYFEMFCHLHTIKCWQTKTLSVLSEKVQECSDCHNVSTHLEKKNTCPPSGPSPTKATFQVLLPSKAIWPVFLPKKPGRCFYTIYKLAYFLAQSMCGEALDSLCIPCASCRQNPSLRGPPEDHNMNRAIWIDWRADKHKEERIGKKGLLSKSRLALFGCFSPWNQI